MQATAIFLNSTLLRCASPSECSRTCRDASSLSSACTRPESTAHLALLAANLDLGILVAQALAHARAERRHGSARLGIVGRRRRDLRLQVARLCLGVKQQGFRSRPLMSSCPCPPSWMAWP